ncbi:MAG: response regulator [Lachnospiraceae bacterium]|nr:response regulator [Lachnospiraceae bacterium]
MKIICVDDEELILNLTVSMCRELPGIDEVTGYDSAAEALKAVKKDPPDLAILDIDMPEINGIKLAARIKEMHPDTSIIFLTGYSQYAVEAFEMHVSGYLLKPVNKERLAEEVKYALAEKKPAADKHIVVKTFGEFDVFVDSKVVSFGRSKAKELLAYLVDRQGGSVTRAEAFSVLYEDSFYDRPMQKQFDVIVRSLKDTLTQYDIADILDIQRGNMRVVPEKFDCDFYRFMEGDIDAINSYRGEYMSSYYWVEETEGYMTAKLDDM